MKRVLKPQHLWLSALFFLLSFNFASSVAQVKGDSAMVRRIYDEALVNGESYENLRSLCKDIGHRLSGSPQADQAVEWGRQLLENSGFDTVYLQPIDVPVWVRGDIEKAEILSSDHIDLQILALGGSVATNGILEATVIEVQSIEQLDTLGEAQLKGKIVFFNRPMEPRYISTFQAYGSCVDQRFAGAFSAARYGAVGVLVRSMTLLEHDDHPHTGSMGYKDGVEKIPGAALSTASANELHHQLAHNPVVRVRMQMNCQTLEEKPSYNVIGEIRGHIEPDKIIAVGGHLDSWDVGEGAHDDGAGIVHSIEALRILKDLGYKPRYTLRVVLFMNEENGNNGGRSYARHARSINEFHVAALESDRGGFSPRGFSLAGDECVGVLCQMIEPTLAPYGLHMFDEGYPGVDIRPLMDTENLVNPNMILMGLIPDSQRYFDYHHSETDVFESVNKRELELGCAALASMIYLIDTYYDEIN